MKKNYLSIALSSAVIFAATTSASHAAQYQIDPTFAYSGFLNLTYAGADFRTLAHLARPDGSSIAVVTYDNNGGCLPNRHCFVLYPFDAAGVPQTQLVVPVSTSFSKRTGGIVLDPFLVRAAAIDSQGRILIGGTEQFGPVFQFKVIRLLPNGQPDTSFGINGTSTPGNFTSENYDLAESMVVDSSDRVILAGSARYSATDTDFAVMRLTTTGALDPTFNTIGKRTIAFDLGSMPRDGATAVAIRPGGTQIYLAGYAEDDGVERIALAKLLPDGTLDESFCATTCTAQGPYDYIADGRRVLFYGDVNDNQSDFVRSLTVNVSGDMVYAGSHQTGLADFRLFTQKVALNGDYLIGHLVDSGFSGTVVSTVGGIRYIEPNSSTSDLVLTGAVGHDSEFFFAQGLDPALVPISGWSNFSGSSSEILYGASVENGNYPGDLPAIPTVDANRRILLGGSYKATAVDPNYSITITRVSPINSADVIFRNGFE